MNSFVSGSPLATTDKNMREAHRHKFIIINNTHPLPGCEQCGQFGPWRVAPASDSCSLLGDASTCPFASRIVQVPVDNRHRSPPPFVEPPPTVIQAIVENLSERAPQNRPFFRRSCGPFRQVFHMSGRDGTGHDPTLRSRSLRLFPVPPVA